MIKHFDYVILSTWMGEESKVTFDKVEVLYNSYPEAPGISHRNYQRLSSANGLRLAKSLGAEYVLKWRTDLLPTSFDLNYLLKKVMRMFLLIVNQG